MRPAAALLAVLLGTASLPQAAPPLGGKGVLLPLQDRMSDPELARVVQETLAERLTPPGMSIRLEPYKVRDAMRRLRLRSIGLAGSETVRHLARDLDAGWMFCATLHAATATPTPQITLSALALSADGREVAWAGFRSATGLDGLRSLGRGVVPDLTTLARQEAAALADDFLTRALAGRPRQEKSPRAARGGYSAGNWTAEELGLVALVPFDSVTDEHATRNAEIITSLARAVLSEHGVRLVSPGAVVETLRSRQAVSLDRMDALTRAALRIATGADHILTGVVEIFDMSPTLDPDPHVSLSARLLEPDSGEILWIHGMEDRGSTGEAPFRRQRIRSAGNLARDMLNSLLAGFLIPPTERPTAEEPSS